MAIFLCTQCNYCREVASEHIDKKAKCPHCGATSCVVDTVQLIKQLQSEATANQQSAEDIKPTEALQPISSPTENTNSNKEIEKKDNRQSRQDTKPKMTLQPLSSSSKNKNSNKKIEKKDNRQSKQNTQPKMTLQPLSSPSENTDLNDKTDSAKETETPSRFPRLFGFFQGKSNTKSNEETTMVVDLSQLRVDDTKAFADDQNIVPIERWFKKKNIKIEVNKSSLDTTGFFDDVAELIGSNYEVLSYVTNQIKYLQSKGYENVKIALANKTQQERDQIITFCKKLYEYSFVSRYFYDKKGQAVRMNIQPSAIIRHFFNGEWLEWYVFISLIKELKNRGISVNIVRNLIINLPNSKIFELDVFLLINNNIPILIECKSGEFRSDIDKYIGLKKYLKFDSSSFFIFALDLDEQQCKGMSAMYGITFVNNQNYQEQIIPKGKI